LACCAGAFLTTIRYQADAAEPDAAANGFSRVTWKNRLNEESLWDGRWRREGSILGINGDQATCIFPEIPTDAAIRVRFRFDGPGGTFIDLNARRNPKMPEAHLVVTMFIAKEEDHHMSAVARYKDDKGNHGVLGGTRSLGNLKSGDEHTIQLCVQGDRLLYYLDGNQVISSDTKMIAPGQLYIFTGSQIHILSVETTELPKGAVLAVARPETSLPAPTTNSNSPPAATNDLTSLGNIVKANHQNLVFVTGTNGSGSGFIVKIGAGNYLVTNAHVAAGVKGAAFKTLNGERVQGGAPALAVDHDIFRMTVASGGKPLELMDQVDANATIGDEIVVLGNAEGAGVVNPIKGKILGIGPNLIEVDASFVPGNSGSPIIHLKTGKVIGVATYMTIRKFDVVTGQKAAEPVIRRFGYRLDSVKTWQPVNMDVFAGQAAELENIEKLTEDFDKLLTDVAKNHKITPGLNINPAIQRPIDLWNADRQRQLSPSDRMLSEQSFVSRLKSVCLNDLADARRQLTYDYFQRKLAEEQRYRDSMAAAIDKLFAKSAAR
jgi:hypothetical protein